MIHTANHLWIWIPIWLSLADLSQQHIPSHLLGNSVGRMQRGGRFAATCPAAWRLETVVCQGRQYCALLLLLLPAYLSQFLTAICLQYVCAWTATVAHQAHAPRCSRYAFISVLPRRNDGVCEWHKCWQEISVVCLGFFPWNKHSRRNSKVQHCDATQFSQHCTQSTNRPWRAAQPTCNNVDGQSAHHLPRFCSNIGSTSLLHNQHQVRQHLMQVASSSRTLLISDGEHRVVPLYCLCGSCHFIYQEDMHPHSHVSLSSTPSPVTGAGHSRVTQSLCCCSYFWLLVTHFPSS